MAYENTEVPVARSQEGIRKLIMARKGGKVAFITDPPREGFTAIVEIDGLPYQIRIFGICREAPTEKRRTYRGRDNGAKDTTEKFRQLFQLAEERRIWRVLFYHMKSVFEAADSGVMEFRELMLPYIVTKSGQTIAEQLLPNLNKAIEHNPARLLNAGS
jgi:hypothetical protein